MTSVPNLARRVPAISFNVLNATRSLRSGSCDTPVGTRFRQRGPNVSSNGAVRRIGIGTRPDDTLGVACPLLAPGGVRDADGLIEIEEK